MTRPRVLPRLAKGFVGLALLGALGIAMLFAFVWLEHRRDVTLPTPTGSFAVGRTIHDWSDPATLDTLAPIPGTKRELLVWIWYPAAPEPSAVTDDYLPARLRPKADTSNHTNIWTLLTRDLSHVRGHSVSDPDVSPRQPAYPVVIFRAG